MTIKETPNKITAVLKVTATAEFFDDEATEETVRYAIEQDLEDAGFDVDVALLKEQKAYSPYKTNYDLTHWRCGNCGNKIRYLKDSFCPHCGREVNWDG